MYYGRGSIVFIAALVIGIGLTFNCLKAIFTREYAYDQESSNTELLANTVGAVIGACMVLGTIGWMAACYNR